MTAGIRSSKNSATASLPGPASALSACSPVAPRQWVFVAIAVHHQTAPIPVFSVRVASQRPAAPAASKPPSNGYRSRAISSPTATGSTSPSPCHICCGPSSTTTGPCSMRCSGQPPAPCYGGSANRAWRSASSVPCTPTAASSTGVCTFTSPSLAVGSVLNTVSGAISFLKACRGEHLARGGHSYNLINPGSLPGLGHIRDKKQWQRYLQAHYGRRWKVHFAKKTRGAAKHFKMVRYYGFLSNRKRGEQLPKVYEALEMEARKKPEQQGFAALMKAFLRTNPYKRILYGNRLRFTGAQAGRHASKLVAERLHNIDRKRWLLAQAAG